MSTCVIGAGIVGSALAMHLAERGVDVTVLDPDLAGARSSSERNAGGVRATWWRPVNISLCARSIEFMRAHADQLDFRPRGYLWLYGPELWEGALQHVDVQNRLGREVRTLTPAQLADGWAFIDNLDGVAGATFSPLDGLVSPDSLRELYRRRARLAGALFLDRSLVVGADLGDGRVRALHVRTLRDAAAAADALEDGRPDGDVHRLPVERVVNAAGPWAGDLARVLGYRSPCYAVPRMICLASCRDVDLSERGMIVDTSGCYFHHEGGDLVLAGYSPPGDPPSHSFRYEGEPFFTREIWPRLANRMSGMDQMRYVRGWTGLYDMSPDCSACLGAAEGTANVFEIHSFSGRGVMQSYAAAEALAELMTEGAFVTEPLAALLAGERFRRGASEPEELHI